MGIWDRIIGFFSRTALAEREYKVSQLTFQKRAYDAAIDASTDDWTSSVGLTSANAEINSAGNRLISRSRDLIRNTPYAKNAEDVIVNNVVGAGILPRFKGPKGVVEKVEKLWREVMETSKCDSEGRLNVYAQQSLALRTIVQSGEVLVIKNRKPESPKFKLIEGDYLDQSKDQFEDNLYKGIKLNDDGERIGYYILKKHPSENHTMSIGDATRYVNSDRVIHAFRPDRPGQLRGVPWSHAVIETLKDFADFTYATVVRQKIAACLVGVIQTTGTDSSLPIDVQRKKRKDGVKMTPGAWKYTDPGETVTFSNPPPPNGITEFTRMIIQQISAGYGVTPESISGDYSQMSFSSSRMSEFRFRNNVDSWRWNMFIPLYCDPVAQEFLEWAKMKGIKTDGITVEWSPPAHPMVNPIDEVRANIEAIDAGLKSRSSVIRESGYSPEDVRQEIADETEAYEMLGISVKKDEILEQGNIYEGQNSSNPNDEGDA